MLLRLWARAPRHTWPVFLPLSCQPFFRECATRLGARSGLKLSNCDVGYLCGIAQAPLPNRDYLSGDDFRNRVITIHQPKRFQRLVESSIQNVDLLHPQIAAFE